MKRLLTILAFLLLAAPAMAGEPVVATEHSVVGASAIVFPGTSTITLEDQWTQLARMNPAVLGSGAAGPVYTDCSNIGTASFYWNGDHTSGTTYGCKNSTTSVNGSMANATVVASGTTPGTVSPESGGNCLLSDSGSDIFGFTITDLVDVTGAEGFYEADVYIGNSSGSNALLLIYQAASNKISISITSTNALSIDHIGGSVQVSLQSTDVIPESTWTKVYARWSVTNNKVSVKIGNGDWKDDADADAVTAFSSNATLFRVLNAGPDVFYIDNIKLYTTSGL